MTGGRRRKFNGRERTALILAADGRCERCGVDLQAGWHADHVTPYSRGGQTDVINGQALCPTCNRKKGSTMPLSPRSWQRRFIAKYHAHTGTNFLCVACPGAGKTHAAAYVAADLLRDDVIDRVLIVVPGATLRGQWARTFSEHGIRIDASTMNDKTDHHPRYWRGEIDTKDGQPVQGWAITYHSLAANPEYHRVLNSRKRTLVILDEVHHLADDGAWGKSANEALDVCTRRLSLSGTPFRSDNAKIPFVTYYPRGHKKAGWVRFTDDDQLGPFPSGFDYSYGKALAERPAPVRPAVFEMYDSDVSWFDGKALKDRVVRISQEGLAKNLRRKANRMVLDPAGQWLEKALRDADGRLTAVRAAGDPDAKGLVVCLDTEHAHAVAQVLARTTHVASVPVAASKDEYGGDSSEHAKATIEAFKESQDRWLVAVAMVSEGVDIPKLRVGVYATTKRTELFFRQVLGRFVRVRPELPEDVDQTAYLFVPKEDGIVALADAVTREIGDGVMASLDLDDEDEPPGERVDGGGQGSLFADQFQGATGEAAGFLLPGAGTFDHDQVNRIAVEAGQAPGVVLGVLQAVQRTGITFGISFGTSAPAAAQQTQVTPEEPWEVRAKARRASLDKAVKQIAGKRLRNQGSGDFGLMVQRVWVELKDRSSIADVRRADVPELDKAVRVAREMWDEL